MATLSPGSRAWSSMTGSPAAVKLTRWLSRAGLPAGRPRSRASPGLSVVGVVVVGPEPTHELLGGAAKQGRAGWVDPGRYALEAEDQSGNSRLLEDPLEPGIGRSPDLLGSHPVGDVLHRAGQLRDGAVVGHLRPRADMDMALLPVRPDDPEGHVERNRPRNGVVPGLHHL